MKRGPSVEELKNMIRCEDGEKVYYIPRPLFVRMVMEQECLERRFVRFDTGAVLYDVSLTQFKNIARDAKARHKINRMVLVDLFKVDAYLANFSE